MSPATHLLRRAASAAQAAAIFLLLELAAVALLHRRELTSAWELQRGSLWLAPSALALALIFGALGYALHGLWWRSAKPEARLSLALVLGALASSIAYGVGGGRHLAAPGLRLGFALGVGVAAAAGAWLGAPRAAELARRKPERAAVSWALLTLLVALANWLILPRLYPAFHWGLGGASLVLATWVSLTAERAASTLSRASRPTGAIGVLSLFALAACGIAPAAERLAHFDNFRFLLLENAPVLGRLVELTARLAPTETVTAADAEASSGACSEFSACGPSASSASGSPGLNLAQHDILLVTVDALRADHVGAYGYKRPTTPHFDSLASEGIVFERAYTATPHTSYAVTSLMTGKYMRPLLLQGAGADSDTWAELLRTYGYRTAAFYPPAIFFIDSERFEPFQKRNLGFEYAKIEFAEGNKRVAQVTDYLREAPRDVPLFLWVHLFGPHEPYEAHPEHEFGQRDIDRYDSEIAAADETLGKIVEAFRKDRPRAAVLLTADHGEEFGDHGGRYHGTTVYEEQLRVPLVIAAPGLLKARRIREVVQTVDLLPTLLGAMSIPRPPRVRGRDLGPLLSGQRPEEPGLAYGETDEQSVLARGSLRLLCARRVGACKLYDLDRDPEQRRDASDDHAAEQLQLRTALRELGASHGRYESQGLRAEGKGFPAAILRGLSGDGDAAADVAALLDDADPAIRRKAAEVLWQLRRKESAGALRLALGRDDDLRVRQFAALALTRLGEGAPLVLELLESSNLEQRRQAALALAESGDRRGLMLLLEEFREGKFQDLPHARDLLDAFATLRAKEAVPALIPRLSDVRLRPYIAQALAKIGE
ncbi:MAG TPA: sulfatase-like hydrolase/transferase, partial [Polyangiaceae bacterium]|nr:sulfatase-like hydrolase/transferase [Polyangiaceae bacterium]